MVRYGDNISVTTSWLVVGKRPCLVPTTIRLNAILNTLHHATINGIEEDMDE